MSFHNMPSDTSYRSDHQLVLSLLNEYSGKLMAVNKELESLADRYYMQRITLYRNALLVVLAPATAWFLVSYYSRRYIGPEYLLLLYPVIFFFMGLLLYSYVISVRRLRRQLINDARLLSLKLERIIRVASQAHDHLEMDYGLKLEFDLRLADAESAIAHFKSL